MSNKENVVKPEKNAQDTDVLMAIKCYESNYVVTKNIKLNFIISHFDAKIIYYQLLTTNVEAKKKTFDHYFAVENGLLMQQFKNHFYNYAMTKAISEVTILKIINAFCQAMSLLYQVDSNNKSQWFSESWTKTGVSFDFEWKMEVQWKNIINNTIDNELLLLNNSNITIENNKIDINSICETIKQINR